jgi:hypothetical protein
LTSLLSPSTGPSSASKRRRHRCSPDRAYRRIWPPAVGIRPPAAGSGLLPPHLASAAGIQPLAAASTWIRSIHHHWSSRSPPRSHRSARCRWSSGRARCRDSAVRVRGPCRWGVRVLPLELGGRGKGRRGTARTRSRRKEGRCEEGGGLQGRRGVARVRLVEGKSRQGAPLGVGRNRFERREKEK